MAAKLYILMRSDMDSLTPGKACAQAAHAANEAVAAAAAVGLGGMLDEWEGDGEFGTTVVLEAPDEYWVDRLTEVHGADSVAGVVVDESYPLRDGSVTHRLPVKTCGWWLGDEADLPYWFRDLGLY